jgi:predicted MFS family arabinose efflux permease
VIYGAWLESSFGLGIVSLGLGTGIIGFAEFLGEGSTAVFADRFGLKRTVITTLFLSTLSYVTLPLIGRTLPLAMTGLFAIFLFIEFTIVSTMSLCTELVPDLRATMMSGFFAAVGIGRVIGAMMGGPVWLSGGILATGMVSAAVNGMALLAIVWGLRGWRKS